MTSEPCDRCGHRKARHNLEVKGTWTSGCTEPTPMPGTEANVCPCDGWFPDGFEANFPRQKVILDPTEVP